MIEVNTPKQIDVKDSDIAIVYADNNTKVEKAADLDIRVAKKEYSIVGDDIYIPKLYDDAPQWMKDLVTTVVNVSLETESIELISQLNSALSSFATSYVPLNQYTQSIINLQNADSSLNALITSLNSTYNDGISNLSGQIIELQLTKATSAEVVAQVIQTISAQLTNSSSSLGATVAGLQQAIVNEESARAASIEAITSTLESLDGNIEGNASAINVINTYVGIENGTSNGTGLLADIQILQKQNDGVIETITGTYDVVLNPQDPLTSELVVTAEPYASWVASESPGSIDVRLAHIGDVYIKYNITSNGAREYVASYKFIRTTVDTTSPYSTDDKGFTWALIVDQAAQDAYEQALNAYDLADGKRRVFVGLGVTTTPSVPYDQGDLWLIDAERIVNGYQCKVGDILRCIETKGSVGTYEQNDWVIASSYANAVAAQAQSVQDWIDGVYSTTISTINTQLDKKAESYYQDTMPHPEGTSATYSVWVGDLWKKPSTNDEYIYQLVGGTYVWVKTDVPDSVYDTIDGKKSIFTGNTIPTAIGVNDMWITGDNPVSPYLPKSIYIWNGISWVIPVRYTDDQYAKDIENGTRQIDLSEHINSLGWTDDSTIDNFLTVTYAVDKLNIQEQIDGKADTYYQGTEPYSFGDLSEAEKLAKDGDVWYDTTPISGVEAYRFSATSGWVKIEDAQTLQALSDAANAQATADGKIQNFTSQPFTPYYVGDTWMQGATGDIYVCQTERLTGSFSQSDWVIASKYTDDTQVIALQTGLANGTVTLNLSSATIDGSMSLSNYVAAEIDKEVVVYSGSNHNTQTGMKANDIYIEKTTAVGTSGVTIDVVNTWKYTGSTWVQIGSNSNLIALADLTDGKRTIYSGNSLPANSTSNPLRPNDLFIPTSTFVANNITYTANEMYRYNGASWEKATRYDEIKSLLQTQIDGKIETHYGGATPPYSNQTNVAKDTRGGDYWYCDTNGTYLKGNIYKYVETSNGSNFNYTWTLSSDVSKGAFDLADKKRIIFGNAGNSVPTLAEGLAIADIWIPSSDGGIYLAGKVYKCTNLNPITFLEVDYTNDEVVNGIINGTTPLDPNTITIGNTNTTFLEYITAEIDGKVGVYSGETAPINGQPSGVAVNDIYIWFTTASKVLANGTTQVYDITRTYKYSGSVWNEITTDSNIVALADLADGKRTVFSGATIPVGAVERDIWIPSANNASYVKGEVYQYIGTAWVIATKYTADLEAVRSNLQSQIDGKVETYYQSTVPTGMTSLNNGDYWYCTADVSSYKKGKVYKYVHATTSWVETADVSRYAFDIADGKASIFSTTSVPTAGYKINDMLIVVGSFNNGTTTFADGVVLSSTANRSSGFTPSDWVKKINDTEDLDAFVNNTYTPTVASLQSQVDGKVESWFQNSTSDPKVAWTDTATRSKHNGDLWYQLDTKRSYWYSSSTNSWNLIDDEKAIQALANAAAAQTTANNAQTSANIANSLLADIANDNKLVPSEKVAVKKEWDIIQSEYTKNLAQGNVYGVSTGSYTSAYNSLSGYITPLLSSLTTTSDIVGITFRGMFKAYYDANVDLLNAVANKINAIADGKITSYYINTLSSLQALSNGWTTAEKASNVGDLATVWDDSILDNNGLWRWNGTSWVSARDKKLVALASDVTNLSTELTNGTNTWASADSILENSLKTVINDEGARVESKFAYNSTVNINGIYKKSGFGLTTNYTSGSGTEVDPYASEFWIDASRLKFTNSNQTGQVAPFTIDATGVTPQITFNGKVSFSNVTNVPQLGSTPQEVVDAVNNGQTTTIDGGKITTGSVTAAQIDVDNVFAQNITYTGVITGGNQLGGGIIQSYDGSMVINLVEGSIYIS